MIICEFEKWQSLKDCSTKQLTKKQWFSILKNKCSYWNSYYPQIYKPLLEKFDYGIILQGQGIEENLNINDHKKYPHPNNSFKCWTDSKKEIDLKKYILIPFNNTMFGIKKENENDNENSYAYGFYKHPVKWLNLMNKNTLWTENKCLLLSEKKFYDIFIKQI